MLTVFAMLTTQAAGASDLEREARLAEEIEDLIVVGDPVYLEADGHEFLSIYTESEEEPAAGTVIVLHGRGFHPDWPQVAAPARELLAERGWNTLSIQLPVLDKEAKYYDYVPIFPEARPRIAAAIAYARDQAKGPVVLVAHSCGVHMAMDYVDHEGDERFDGFVGIGMGATDYGQPMRKPFPLAQMQVPVLDVYGADEYPAVLRMAPERLAATKSAGNSDSSQIEIAGGNHYFDDDASLDVMVDAVAEWLSETDFRTEAASGGQ
jgi:predicted alpha/beta-hydrolase family hydrolase